MAIQEKAFEGYRISPQQRRLWRLRCPGDLFQARIALAIEGPLRIEKLQDALARLTGRHEALRTCLASGAGLSLPLQVVDPFASPPRWESLDLSGLAPEAARARLAEWIDAAGREEIDVGETPLWRAGLARLEAERHVLAIAVPALLADGSSLVRMASELGLLYAGGEPEGEPLQYADYAEWQIELLETGEEDADRAQQAARDLAALPPLALPFALPAAPPGEAAPYAPLALERPSAAAGPAVERGAALGASAGELLLAVFHALLGRLAGRDELAVACRFAGRDHADLQSVVGLLSRWVPVSCRHKAGGRFSELLDQVREAAEDAAAWSPWFLWSDGGFPEVGFGLDEAPERIEAGEVSFSVLQQDAVCDRCDLELLWQRRGGAWTARWRWDPARFRRGDVESLAERYECLLAAVAEAPERRLADLPLLTVEEQRASAAPDGAPAASTGFVHRLFEEAARRTPEAPALSCGEVDLVYAELDARANRLAHHLLHLGVGPEVRVGVSLERSQEGIVALLAVLKAGGVYVPVEPEQPAARLAAMLEDAGVRVVVMQESQRVRLASGTVARLVAIDAEREEIGVRPSESPDITLDGSNLAYVIFTSGSTGRPKGVAVEHRQLATYVRGVLERLEVPAGASFATVSTFAADLGHTAIFPALCTGGHLHVVPADRVADPAGLAELFRQRPVDVLKMVPSLLRSLLASPQAAAILPRECLVLGGEACSWDLVERVRALAPRCRVLNHYGPTETTVGVLVHEPGREGERDPRCATVPLGRPLAGIRARVLDGEMRPVPTWTAGDLAIGGATVSRGYLGRPDLTAERFVPDPLSAEPGARLYRTGDRARVTAGGFLEFLGRGDQQVKIRGFRVELEEVRAALARHPEVTDGAAVLRQGREGESALVAFYVAPRSIEARELRERMAESLPEEVLPNFFVHLPRLPLTVNGKLDAAALPALEEIQRRAGASAPSAARTPTEAALAGLWAEVLGVDQVGIEERFFDLGGHSLLATRLIARTQEVLGVALPLRRFLEEPTVAGMAMAVARVKAERQEKVASERELPPVVPRPQERFEPFPLNEVQQAYWVGRLGAFELGNVATHTYFEFERRGLDLARFESALQALIARHDMLRAVVLPDGFQRVLESVPPYEIRVQDLRGRRPDEVEAALAAVRAEMSEQVLSPETWPLFDFRVSLLDGDRVRLHISRDALIFDAWSAALVFSEWARLYCDPAAELPALELTFRDYVLAEQEFHRSEAYARALDYWLRRLPTLAPAPELPLVRNPASLEKPRFVHRSARLAAGDWQRLKRRAARAGLTPSGLVAAAFSEVLAAWSKSPRFTLNLTLFHRLPLHPQVESVVGDFTSMVLLEFDPAAGVPFELRARQLQERLWEDLEHRDVSGVRVLRELRQQRRSSGALMPVVLTSLLAVGDAERDRERRELLGEMVWGVGVTSQVWLDHAVMEQDGALLFHWNFVEELFPPGLLDSAFASYAALLQSLADEEETWSAAPLRLVPAAQLAVREAVNATAATLPEGLLHEPFLARAAEQPDRVAVVAGEVALTYGELAWRANRLARQLRALGARPGRLVAVVMEKGWEQVVATLGVLGAGAAYMPVDPALPAERRRHLIERGEAEIALTQSWLEEALEWPEGLVRVAVGRDPLAGEPETAPEPLQSPLDLAYVLFTSGSTGQPKGVMIDHRGALNTVADVNRRFDVGPEDRVLALSSLGFDLSVWDVFGTLAAGGAIVLPEPKAVRDPARWAELVERHRVTIWNSVPAFLEMLVEHAAVHPEVRLAGLRLVLLSGDWIPLSLPDRLRALAPRARLISLGGATEASIWSILYPVERVEPEWASIPYGRPMDNQSFHVLDPLLEPRPDWVPGELYIGGVGLAQGYWRDEEKTRAAFLQHPRTGERLYRTGDLGRYLPDGTIEFLGREDHQVKVQGHRIELGEIEAVLEQHLAVRAAVVAAPGTREHRRLVAYVVPSEPLAAAPPAAPVPGGLDKLLFKLSEPGLRDDLDRSRVELAGGGLDAALDAWLLARRSRRSFLAEPLPAASLGRFLSVLRQAPREGSAALARYRYGSAGGLYPVQAYLWVRSGRCEGLPGGTYYYHPREHRLVSLAAGAELDRSLFSEINRPVFDQAAFAVFLVGQMRAIEPVYGDAARHYATLEAGLVTQLLEISGPAVGVGLCQIGGLEFERVAPFLNLDEGHVLLHTLLGGGLDPEAGMGEDEGEGAHLPGAAPARERASLTTEMRDFLRRKLPDYMVPRTWVFLDSLPLTANGKVDRGALPEPERAQAEAFSGGEAARGPAEGRTSLSATEELLARIWTEVLKVDEVGPGDDFFTLGGHCLLAVQIAARIREIFQVDVPLPVFFEATRVADLAQRVEETLRAGRAAEPPLERVPRDQPLPLSFPQERQWFLAQLDPQSSIYNHPAAARLRGRLDLAALERCLTEIARRHEILRTTYQLRQGRPVQVVSPPQPVPVAVTDLSALPGELRDLQARRWMFEEARRPFDLARGPVLRCALLRLAPEEHLLLFTLHHVAGDHWSGGVLLREMAALYEAFSAGRPSPLPELPLQYADFAAWQRRCWSHEGVLELHLDYWRRQLSGAPALLELPLDRPRPPVQTFEGARLPFELSTELSARFRELAHDRGVTLFMALLAGLQTLLFHLSGQDDLVVGSPVAGRDRAEVEGMIGCFINALALRGELSGDPTFIEVLARVRRATLGAYAHRELPFEKLVEELQPRRDPAYTPVFQAVFNFQSAPMPPLLLPGLSVETVEVDTGRAKYDFTFYLGERQDRLAGALEYNVGLFEPRTAERLLRQLEALLVQVTASPEVRLSALSHFLTEREKEQTIMMERELDQANLARLRNVRRRAVSAAPEDLVGTELLAPDQMLPLVVHPKVEGVDLAQWVRGHLDWLEEKLHRHGAILFRGFAVESPAVFEGVVNAITPELANYVEGSSPRILVTDKVYTSTEYPPEYFVSMHNELSYAHRWPSRIYFYCSVAPVEGGETPIADSRTVFERIPAEVRERFATKRLCYLRNLHGGQGAGLAWQTVFETDDRERVEAYCREGNIDFRWTEDGGLRTSQDRPAVVNHPKTGERVWFNQADQWHPSNLEEEVARALLATTAVEDLPIHATFADGSPLDPADLDAVREAFRECRVVFPWQQGDVLVVDNTLVAHGRMPFRGPRKILVAMGGLVSLQDIGESP